MLVLEAWIVTFGESLVENARWKLGLSLLAKVSWKMLVLEAGLSLLAKVSWKLLVLEACLVVSTKSVQQECQERVSSKSVQQECLAGVSCNNVQLECQSKNV